MDSHVLDALECFASGVWLTFSDWLICRGASKAFSTFRINRLVQLKIEMKGYHRSARQKARELFVDGEWSEEHPECCLRLCRRRTGLWLPRDTPLCVNCPRGGPQCRVAKHLGPRDGVGRLSIFPKPWLVVCSERCCREARTISQLLWVAPPRRPYGVVLGVDKDTQNADGSLSRKRNHAASRV